MLKQADTYYRLAKQESLTEAEHLQKTVCRKAMECNGILYRADHDQLRNNVESLNKKISARRDKLDEVQKKYTVYRDILETFFEVSKDDYITNLEKEERKRKEELSKKKKNLKR